MVPKPRLIDGLLAHPDPCGDRVAYLEPSVIATFRPIATEPRSKRRSGTVVELVVVACLMAEPKRCEAFHLPFLRALVVTECIGKQPIVEIVRWAREHPDWSIRKWTCGPPRA